jgi:hypothetical protein
VTEGASSIGSKLASLAVMAAVAGANSPAQAAQQDLTWRGATRLALQCQLNSPTADALQAALCERLRALSADGAPIPVTVLAPGDPGLLEPRTVALLAHFSVQPAGDHSLLVFTIRLHRAGEEAALFGASPRAVPLPPSGELTSTVDAALRAALSETLPWLAPRRAGSGPKPL